MNTIVVIKYSNTLSLTDQGILMSDLQKKKKKKKKKINKEIDLTKTTIKVYYDKCKRKVE